MNLLSLLTDIELETLTQLAQMYGVESDQYTTFWNSLADKYENVILINFNKLRAIEGGKNNAALQKKNLDPDKS